MVVVEIFFPLIMGVISLFFWPLFLMISTRIFKTQDRTYKTAFKVMLWPIIISTILSIMPIFIINQTMMWILWIFLGIGLLVLNLWLIKVNYSVGFGRAFVISLVAGLIGLIPYVIIVVTMAVIMAFISGFLIFNTIT